MAPGCCRRGAGGTSLARASTPLVSQPQRSRPPSAVGVAMSMPSPPFSVTRPVAGTVPVWLPLPFLVTSVAAGSAG